MYLSSKTSKIALKFSNSFSLQRALANGVRHQQRMIQMSQMNFMQINSFSAQQQRYQPMHQVMYRSFADLPKYTKLEMPNLSPTMEKVLFSYWS